MATKKLQILDSLGFVSYNPQTLTDEQQTQARANIGAEIATDDEIMDMLAELGMVAPVATSDGSILTSPTGEIYSL